EQVFPQAFGDGALGGLGCAVDSSVGVGHAAGSGAEVHDVATAARHHAGHDSAGDVEQTFDVGVDHLLPVLTLAFVQLVEAAAEAGVVDQNVDVSPFLRQGGDGALHGGVIGDVELESVDS